MKWYELTYFDHYGKTRNHYFSGNIGTVRMVLNAYNIDVDQVTAFTVNDEPVQITHYIREGETE